VWFYRLVTPDSIEIYPMPEAASPSDYDRRGRIIEELNQRHGVPPNWIESGEGWDVALLEGDLHPSLIAASNMHPIGEVPSGDLPPEPPEDDQPPVEDGEGA
jgi:hypothetical protein